MNQPHIHVLYAIECGGWIEEVGCEECDFMVTGQKGPPWPRNDVPTGTQKCGLCNGIIPCGCPAEILPVSYPDHLDENDDYCDWCKVPVIDCACDGGTGD